ncbi:hypothetical protein DH2020_022689 [Rehmannia glutinosa]|uniref:Uncharacterized protein n=1 Tax=Rehmannia glutinosa TaxID=99300 RepID=A0ABR0W3V5_REHGL
MHDHTLSSSSAMGHGSDKPNLKTPRWSRNRTDTAGVAILTTSQPWVLSSGNNGAQNIDSRRRLPLHRHQRTQHHSHPRQAPRFLHLQPLPHHHTPRRRDQPPPHHHRLRRRQCRHERPPSQALLPLHHQEHPLPPHLRRLLRRQKAPPDHQGLHHHLLPLPGHRRGRRYLRLHQHHRHEGRQSRILSRRQRFRPTDGHIRQIRRRNAVQHLRHPNQQHPYLAGGRSPHRRPHRSELNFSACEARMRGVLRSDNRAKRRGHIRADRRRGAHDLLPIGPNPKIIHAEVQKSYRRRENFAAAVPRRSGVQFVGDAQIQQRIDEHFATEGANKFDFTVQNDGEDVKLQTKVVTATIKGTLIDEDPLAVYKIDKVLLPRELFKAAPAAPGPKSARSRARDEADSPGPAADDEAPADEDSSNDGGRIFGGGGILALSVSLILGLLV